MTLTVPTTATRTGEPTDPPAPTAILFDWDNTLVDTWPTIHQVVNVLMTHMGHPTWTLEETKRRIGPSMRDVFPTMFGDRWQEAGEVFLSAFRAIHLEQLAVLDGMEPMVRGLAERGVPMGIVSNKTGALLRREITHLGWDDLFFASVGAGDATRDKPARDAVDLALATAPGGPLPLDARVWFVGDSPTDMTCAETCGCTPILLRRWAPEDGEFDLVSPLVHLSHGDHLLTMVDAARAARRAHA
ncbi:HAD hydrolase-like protein [Roseospira marina]|uniref:phosphoglycolate phosphatase n=1 Tax=Roseospira marina TaxID=140057 RepID=A0A5M6IGB4_9PROT|nr:HAD hydrolase-like protein [Roseospira marina]KAA5607303.1 HAD hydrolase-like protein [Roseospira marina]MBB4312539.1 phosphoglycolate phosphatase [Roseospira marina]MBB5085445.1 phosphoglycolate phosphatase [Roseospira marina]